MNVSRCTGTCDTTTSMRSMSSADFLISDGVAGLQPSAATRVNQYGAHGQTKRIEYAKRLLHLLHLLPTPRWLTWLRRLHPLRTAAIRHADTTTNRTLDAIAPQVRRFPPRLQLTPIGEKMQMSATGGEADVG